MLPTGSKTSSSKAKHEGYQVLNISNVNAQNQVVLNDEQLLALIQQYPFLYNPHVRPHNDADYDAWAWDQIAKAFNRTYESLDRNVSFTTEELNHRWKVLQPIVRSLSKINNISSLPDTLRQTVVKMSVPMDENPSKTLKKPLTAAQKTLFKYENLIKELPIADRRRLEAEMMELILYSELDSKGTIKLGVNELQTIEKDYNEFLKSISLDDLYTIEQNTFEMSILNSIPQRESPGFSIVTNGTTIFVPDVENKKTEAENEGFQLASIKSENTMQVEETENNLLEPMINKRWIPLDRWRDYVRKCRIRIKRVVLEDEIPLAKIKREKIEQYVGKDYILPD